MPLPQALSRVLCVAGIAFLAWALAIALHTGIIVSRRFQDKRNACIPPTVLLPSVADETDMRSTSSRLAKVFRAAAARGIRVWAVFGTALGLERHGGRIPWDDDFDFAIMEEDLPRLHAFFSQGGEGAHLRCGFSNIVKKLSSCTRIVDADTGEALTDLFPMKVSPTDSTMTELAWNSLMKSRFDPVVATPVAAIQAPLEWRDFDGDHVPALRDNRAMVQTWFGKRSLEEAVIDAPHQPLLMLLFHLNPFLVRRFPIYRSSMVLTTD